MVTFIIRRLLGLIAVMLVLSVLVFLLFFETPGVDPARLMAGRNPNPETIAAIKHEFGLDRPLPVRYALMMKRFAAQKPKARRIRPVIDHGSAGWMGR